MAVTIFFLVLICSLSTAERQCNCEIIPQGKDTESQERGPASALDPQHVCPGDIHAVLREMSALLAEQKVEMRHLQKENEGTVSQALPLSKDRNICLYIVVTLTLFFFFLQH